MGVKLLKAAQVQVIGADIGNGLRGNTRLILTEQCYLERRGYLAGDFLLDREDVNQVAVVGSDHR